MFKQVLFAHHEGEGYISDQFSIPDTFDIESYLLAGELIQPGMMTDLKGFLIRPIKYCGRKKSELLFYMGKEDDKHYFKTIYRIEENRILIRFSSNGSRDFSYKNGRWSK